MKNLLQKLARFMPAPMLLLYSGMTHANIVGQAAATLFGGVDALLSAILSLIAFLLFCFLCAVVMMQAGLGDVMLAIGLAFGPLLLAFYPVMPALTDRLIGFVATAIGLKAIAAFVVSLLGAVLGDVGELVSNAQDAVDGIPFIKTLAIASFIMITIFFWFVVMKIPEIASGLFGGASLGLSMPGPRGVGAGKAAAQIKSITTKAPAGAAGVKTVQGTAKPPSVPPAGIGRIGGNYSYRPHR